MIQLSHSYMTTGKNSKMWNYWQDHSLVTEWMNPLSGYRDLVDHVVGGRRKHPELAWVVLSQVSQVQGRWEGLGEEERVRG